jgi:hypothetical protein
MEMETSSKNPKRVAAGRRNGPLRRQRFAEERQRARERCLHHRPWQKATGPRTAEGKATASANGRANKPNPESLRQIRLSVADANGLIDMMDSLRSRMLADRVPATAATAPCAVVHG